MLKTLASLVCISTLLVCGSCNGVSKSDQETILEVHNGFRKQIANGEVPNQPRGINLKKLKWNESLAKAAQELANTFVFEHDIPENTDFETVGQNLGQTTGETDENPDWTNVITQWFEEHKIYTYSNQLQSGTGHYTQIVWANTEYVGCGYAQKPGTKLYVCNYGEAGNFMGQYPYETGDSGCENLC